MPRLLPRKGFSFWEFAIIVAIVVVLVAIAFPRLFSSKLHIETQPAANVAPGSSSPVSVRLLVGGRLADTKEKITFAVAEGGGRVEPTVVETDATGKATTTWILGSTPGTRNALTATAEEGATARIEVLTGGAVTTAPAGTTP